MAGKMKTIAIQLKTLLQGVNDGGTPTPKNYFDQVWIGMPDIPPQGAKNIAMIQPLGNPTFYYTTCPEQTTYDVDFNIHIMCKGRVEDSTLQVLEVTEAVQNALIGHSKINDTCISSTIEQVDYGEFARVERNLVAGSKILLRCNV